MPPQHFCREREGEGENIEGGKNINSEETDEKRAPSERNERKGGGNGICREVSEPRVERCSIFFQLVCEWASGSRLLSADLFSTTDCDYAFALHTTSLRARHA